MATRGPVTVHCGRSGPSVNRLRPRVGITQGKQRARAWLVRPLPQPARNNGDEVGVNVGGAERVIQAIGSDAAGLRKPSPQVATGQGRRATVVALDPKSCPEQLMVLRNVRRCPSIYRRCCCRGRRLSIATTLPPGAFAQDCSSFHAPCSMFRAGSYRRSSAARCRRFFNHLNTRIRPRPG
jgi:hypothetical protein